VKKKLEDQIKIFKGDIDNLQQRSQDLSSNINKTQKNKMEHQKKLATLHNELEKIAMIGYDESFGGFVELMIEQVKTDERLQHEEKKTQN